MKTIYNVICILCLSAIAAYSHAASEAEYGKVEKSWVLHADGSQEYRYTMELTLFTHTAMNSTYGESFILYNPKFQELEILTSYTRQTDGTIIKTPDNAFVEVLPRNAADAPFYNHLKEMVVVHTGLELGATIYLEYVLKTKPGYFDALDIYEPLQETSPVKNYTATISVPENTPLHHQLTGTTAKTTEVITEGTKSVIYSLYNVPATSREPFQMQNRDNAPLLTASTYASIEEALSLLSKKLSIGHNMEAEAFAEYTVYDETEDKGKAALIQKHIVQNMGTSQVDLEQTGYKTRNASVALRSAYGTAAEKAILLAVMLNAVEIPAEVVAVYSGHVDPVGLKGIKNLLVQAKIGKDVTYLSPVSLAAPTVKSRGELDQIYTLSGKQVEVKAAPLVIAEKREIKLTKEQNKNGYIVYMLPAIPQGIDAWGMRTLNSQRKEVFEIPSLLEEEIAYEITLEEGIELKISTPRSVTYAAVGSFSQTISREGNKVVVKRTIRLDKQQYSSAEYKLVRELIQEWNNPSGRTLLFSVM
ncbi:hypothetical protein M2480_001053 [Parabacteroides sp. PFB2-12]|uniref:DUF3857 domain-containing protein n=1 Tax=unclassified Parabacteroides TaxID=2649774 RepID=UPI002474D0E1|nr:MULTISPECIES: DUF3857 domain-containing protein [unclassified Parabacteroides]MDH6342431.1 hypothetical protein [Parabacteroides sp. PM6-13]MDH6390083.1 hypothetical protein [Parabacteroides sp. PFB2-12]